ncbi:DNA polymerase III subunit beta [Candidatus Tachikawaea gelatinosa]|uniref:Beta sliding clamp n=1 Tax=Candidatus Tachikawaea gelatinosa TaxID=1410383 RepID=A0A090AR85_9ENTR|nr:DNA polymerase III subunit beta [Candidatus Tachikawaea gelatinosa]BAP58280.1 DNA polymerase III subunit beta [Candidatus Tachikawaea gelatinosa]
MKFVIERNNFTKSLQKIVRLVVSRPLFPILNNVLLKTEENNLLLTVTDLEIELIAKIELYEIYEYGEISVSAKKLFNICRSFSENIKITLSLQKNIIFLSFKNSRFSLATLPAKEFPYLEKWECKQKLFVDKEKFKKIIESTFFSMANQDIRYYLNGMFFLFEKNKLQVVATDGHRMSINSMPINDFYDKYSIIVPRKAIIELLYLLKSFHEEIIEIKIGKSNIRIYIGNIIFTSKLVDGNFPDYNTFLSNIPTKTMDINRLLFKEALLRISILSNETNNSITLDIKKNLLSIFSSNSIQEKGEEVLKIYYNYDNFKIAFNVSYMIDILHTLDCQNVRLLFTDELSSIKIIDINNPFLFYIIMPIRL